MHAKNVFGPFSSFSFSFVFHFVDIIKCQIYYIKTVLEKSFCLQLTKMEKRNDPLYILSSTGHRLYQRMSNVPLAHV